MESTNLLEGGARTEGILEGHGEKLGEWEGAPGIDVVRAGTDKERPGFLHITRARREGLGKDGQYELPHGTGVVGPAPVSIAGENKQTKKVM